MELSEQGFDVQFPEASNQAGFDLIVDGQPMQVKCLSDASGLYDHFDTYPDIPVLLNADLAESLGDMDNVYPCPGITSDSIESITRDTIESAQSLTDFHVPVITLAVSSCNNAFSWMTGSTDGKHALINVTTDVVGRAVASSAGQWIGALGYLFTPAGGVIGQALGATIGAWAGGGIARHFRKSLAGEQYAAVSESFSRLCLTCANAQSESIQRIWEKIDVIEKQSVDSAAKQTVIVSIIQRMQNELAYREDWNLRLCSVAKRSVLMEPNEMVELFLNSQVEHPVHMSRITSEVATFTSCLSALDVKINKLKIKR